MKMRRIAVGFADLANYARLIETVGIAEAIGYLQDAFQSTGDAILKHGGKIHKYVGDAVLFYFDDPRAAAAAATEIAERFRRNAGDLSLRCAVAVAYGEVAFCRIGHPSLLSDDIMGEPVNRAAGLLKEAAASSSGIAFCEEMKRYQG